MIKFGTDGWRALIADEFTFENIRIVTQALVNYQKKLGIKKGIAIGYDHRFESENFAAVAAEVISQNGITAYLSKIPLSSPALSYYVKSNSMDIGIMITASHNPPAWNGFKIKEAFGGSSNPETTKGVEAELQGIAKSETSDNPKEIVFFNNRAEYLKHMSSFVDLDLIKKANINAIADPMFGSGANYLKEILGIREINNYRDPLFGGVNPEPIPQNLQKLKEETMELKGQLGVGLSIDGDGDRIGGYDPSGLFLSSQYIYSLLLYHLVENKKLTGKVIKTFNISRLVEKQAKKYSLPVEETKIGFKYIADFMIKDKVLMGGEESGGMGIQGNIPERDGVLCSLLLLELMAMKKKTLKEILDGIMAELGTFYYKRVDVHTEKNIPAVPDSFLGKKIIKTENLDGIKFNFEDESWILFRKSGTEPLMRIYAEGKSPEEVDKYLAEGQKLIKEID